MSSKEWTHRFFGGKEDFYGTSYHWLPDRIETEREVDGILHLLNPLPGAHILDWCGGWGRHAIPLLERGFRVTLLDFCKEYIEIAEEEARQRGFSPGDSFRTVRSDFRRTPASIQADYAINLFSAGIGYFEESDDIRALRSLAKALRPGARFLIDTMNLLWIMRNFKERDFRVSQDGTKRFLSERKFNFWENRIVEKAISQDRATLTETQRDVRMRIYSPRELACALRKSGFEPLELYGNLDGSPFGFDSRRIVLISERK